MSDVYFVRCDCDIWMVGYVLKLYLTADRDYSEPKRLESASPPFFFFFLGFSLAESFDELFLMSFAKLLSLRSLEGGSVRASGLVSGCDVAVFRMGSTSVREMVTPMSISGLSVSAVVEVWELDERIGPVVIGFSEAGAAGIVI